MQQLFAIALGGAFGALSRYWAVGWISGLLPRSFPFGTLLVNISGSLLIGIAYVLILERLEGSSHWQALIMVGFIGAFTTFSTFSLETLMLLQDGKLWAACAYVLASVLVCLLAVGLGIWLARQLI